MKDIVNLNDFMYNQLRLLYDSEMQLTKVLPELLKEVYNPQLKDLLETFCDQEGSDLGRMKQTFELLFLQKRGEKSQGMKAIVKEMKELVHRGMDNEVIDAIIINSLQHMLHYQIAGYGAACSYANILQLDEVAARAHMNLEGKKRMDLNLAMIAEETINPNAKEVTVPFIKS